MHIEWSILPRGDVPPHWSRVYATINRHGAIMISRVTYQRMGEPAAFLVMFDRVNSRIALKPTGAMMKNAYPAGKYGRYGGRVIRAFRLLTEYGIKVTDTLEFKDAEIDLDGQLILDLRTAKVCIRGRNTRSKSEEGNKRPRA